MTSFARHRAVRAHSRVDSCVSRTVVRVVLRVSRVPFAHVITRRVRASSCDDHVCHVASTLACCSARRARCLRVLSVRVVVYEVWRTSFHALSRALLNCFHL